MATNINKYSPIFRKVPSNQPAIAGQTTAFSLPVGEVTYNSVTLVYKKAGTRATYAQVVADLKRIRVVMNGETIWNASARTIVDTMTLYMGLPFDNGEVRLQFAMPTARTPELEGLTALGMKGITSFRIEVDIDGAAGASLDLKCETDILPFEQHPNWVLHVQESNVNTYQVGDNELQLPRESGQVLAMHWKTGDATEFEIRKGNAVISQGDLTFINNTYKRYGRVPQAGYLHYDPTRRDNVVEAVNFADELDNRIIMTVAATGAFAQTVISLKAPFGLEQPAK